MFLSKFSFHKKHKYSKGFTFFEVLIAISILAFGLTAIFRIFFGSVSALQNIKNRIEAHLFIEKKIWDTRNLVKQSYVMTDFNQQSNQGEGVPFDCDIKLRKMEKFPKLFSLEITVSWNERSRNIKVSRQLFIKGI